MLCKGSRWLGLSEYFGRINTTHVLCVNCKTSNVHNISFFLLLFFLAVPRVYDKINGTVINNSTFTLHAVIKNLDAGKFYFIQSIYSLHIFASGVAIDMIIDKSIVCTPHSRLSTLILLPNNCEIQTIHFHFFNFLHFPLLCSN